MRRQHRAKHRARPGSLLLPCLVGVLVANAGLALYASSLMEALRDEVALRLDQRELAFHGVAARVQYQTSRSRLASGLEAAIPALRPSVRREDAVRYAELVLDVVERYETVDPLLLISVGIVESGFDVDAVSHAGARGLYQIYPPTGKVLARSLGWEYSDDLLHDPAKNTELAASYLGILGAAYHDVSLVLAEYNGGPLNAGYFRAEAEQLAEETKNYVPRVLGVYERLSAELRRDGEAAARRIE